MTTNLDRGIHPSSRSLLGLDVLSFIMSDVRGGLGPFVAVYLASVHHWDAGRIGMALAIMGAAGLVSETPAGALVDWAREKRLVLACAFAAVGLGSLAMVFWATPTVVLISQALIGSTSTVFGPAMAGLTLGLVGSAGLARRTGRNQAFDHAGNVAAAIIAGVIGESLGAGAIFVMAAVMCVVGIAATALIRGREVDPIRARGGFQHGRSSSDQADSSRPTRIRDLLGDRTILSFAVAVVLFHLGNAAMLPLVGQKIAATGVSGASGAMASAIVAAQLVMIPVALLSSRLAAAWGRKPTFLIGFAILPIRGLLSAWSVQPAFLVAVQLLDGVGAGIFGVVAVLVAADLARGTGRFNLLTGVVATATGLGASLSNLVTGFIVKAAGFDAGFIMLAAVAAIALAFYWAKVPETLSLEESGGGRAISPADSSLMLLGSNPLKEEIS